METQREQRAAVSASEAETLLALVAQLPGMMYRCRLERARKMLFVSEGCFDLTGIRAERFINEPALSFDALIHPDDRESVFRQIIQSVAEQRPYRLIYRLMLPDSGDRWVLERGRALKPDAIDPLLVGFITDHTERMHTLQGQEKQIAIMEERNRLARELHDSVTQSLYSLTLFAEAGRNLTQQGEFERAGHLFDDLLLTGQQALKEMRLMVHKLRPSLLEKEGLVRAIQHRLNAVEGRAGVHHQLVIEGAIDLSPEIEDALYSIAQEALNNTLKHANANSVRLTLRQTPGNLTMLIVDDGVGYSWESAASGGGLGLTSMRERAVGIGSSITFETAAGEGSTVRVEVPLKQQKIGVQNE